MAQRRVRDYAAEQRRRNELARERGFTSRGQQRHAVGRAKQRATYEPKRPITATAEKFLLAVRTDGIERKGSKFPEFGGHKSTPTERAQDWSDIYARSGVARFEPDERPEGMSKREYTNAYLAAFVRGDQRYVDVRHRGGSEALRHWFVDIQGYMSADEYESRYGKVK